MILLSIQHQHTRHFNTVLFISQKQYFFLLHFLFDRRRVIHILEIREQFRKVLRFETITTQNIGTYLAALFNQTYIDLMAMLFLQLFQSDSGS